MEKYLIQYRPGRENFDSTASEDEWKIVESHFNYLKDQCDSGKLLFAGRTESSTLGIAVFLAETDEKAREFVNSDPAVDTGTFTATVERFRLALPQS